MPRSSIAKAEGMRILAMTESQRRHNGLPVTMDEIAEKLEVHISQPYRWLEELENFQREHETAPKRNKPRKRTIEQDQQEVYQKMLTEALGGSVTAGRLLFEKWGMLIKKEEITHRLDGGAIARAILEAEYELRGLGEGQGMGKVQEKPALLPDHLHSSPGQGETGEGEVPDMDSSSETD